MNAAIKVKVFGATGLRAPVWPGGDSHHPTWNQELDHAFGFDMRELRVEVRDKPRIAGRPHELIAAGELAPADVAAMLGELAAKLQQDGGAGPGLAATVRRYVKLAHQGRRAGELSLELEALYIPVAEGCLPHHPAAATQGLDGQASLPAPGPEQVAGRPGRTRKRDVLLNLTRTLTRGDAGQAPSRSPARAPEHPTEAPGVAAALHVGQRESGSCAVPIPGPAGPDAAPGYGGPGSLGASPPLGGGGVFGRMKSALLGEAYSGSSPGPCPASLRGSLSVEDPMLKPCDLPAAPRHDGSWAEGGRREGAGAESRPRHVSNVSMTSICVGSGTSREPLSPEVLRPDGLHPAQYAEPAEPMPEPAGPRTLQRISSSGTFTWPPRDPVAVGDPPKAAAPEPCKERQPQPQPSGSGAGLRPVTPARQDEGPAPMGSATSSGPIERPAEEAVWEAELAPGSASTAAAATATVGSIRPMSHEGSWASHRGSDTVCAGPLDPHKAAQPSFGENGGNQTEVATLEANAGGRMQAKDATSEAPTEHARADSGRLEPQGQGAEARGPDRRELRRDISFPRAPRSPFSAPAGIVFPAWSPTVPAQPQPQPQPLEEAASGRHASWCPSASTLGKSTPTSAAGEGTSTGLGLGHDGPSVDGLAQGERAPPLRSGVASEEGAGVEALRVASRAGSKVPIAPGSASSGSDEDYSLPAAPSSPAPSRAGSGERGDAMPGPVAGDRDAPVAGGVRPAMQPEDAAGRSPRGTPRWRAALEDRGRRMLETTSRVVSSTPRVLEAVPLNNLALRARAVGDHILQLCTGEDGRAAISSDSAPPRGSSPQDGDKAGSEQMSTAVGGGASAALDGGPPPAARIAADSVAKEEPAAAPDPAARKGSALGSEAWRSMGLPEVLPGGDAEWVIPRSALSLQMTPEMRLGHGGFGTVYRAVMHGVQPVAVKVLHKQDDESKRDFLRECAMMFRLRHENILLCHGACVEDDEIMLVTSLMRENLYDALKAGRCTWDYGGARVAHEVALGLAHLHSRRVVHLDLKSPNILLDRDGHAKLADMGLARVVLRHSYVASHVGTWHFAAPEVLNGDATTDRADIFSYGMVLWEILTGRPARRGALNFASDDPVPPPDIRTLLEACLACNPQVRPSAADVCKVLEQYNPM